MAGNDTSAPVVGGVAAIGDRVLRDKRTNVINYQSGRIRRHTCIATRPYGQAASDRRVIGWIIERL